jgi:hypothetical protein
MRAKSKFIPILTTLFNECIKSSYIPSEWKCAVVTPLFKNKGDKSDPNNYRGISVLSPITKLFEKIIAKQISSFFENNNILSDGQLGCRHGRSCETALHEIISKLNDN